MTEPTIVLKENYDITNDKEFNRHLQYSSYIFLFGFKTGLMHNKNLTPKQMDDLVWQTEKQLRDDYLKNKAVADDLKRAEAK